jgi:hypothetical protein
MVQSALSLESFQWARGEKGQAKGRAHAFGRRHPYAQSGEGARPLSNGYGGEVFGTHALSAQQVVNEDVQFFGVQILAI